MDEKLDIITIGESLIELSSDTSLSSTECLHKYYGGDALTTAIAALRLGSRVGFITRVGNDVFKDYYHQWGAWIVFGAGITPFPYKVVTIASGVVHLDVWVFGIASVIARGMRFYLVAWLLKKYGEPMKVFIEKNLGLLSVLFLLLLIGGFAAIKFI